MGKIALSDVTDAFMFKEGCELGGSLGVHTLDSVSITLRELDQRCPNWYFKAYPVKGKPGLYVLRGFAKTDKAKDVLTKTHQALEKKHITKLIRRTGLHAFYATAIVRSSKTTIGYYSEKVALGVLNLITVSKQAFEMPTDAQQLVVILDHFEQPKNYNENTMNNIVLLLPKIVAILNKPIKK